jgi:hypothetical protein
MMAERILYIAFPSFDWRGAGTSPGRPHEVWIFPDGFQDKEEQQPMGRDCIPTIRRIISPFNIKFQAEN